MHSLTCCFLFESWRLIFRRLDRANTAVAIQLVQNTRRSPEAGSGYFFKQWRASQETSTGTSCEWTWATLPWPVSTRIAVSFSTMHFDAAFRTRYACAIPPEMHYGPITLDGRRRSLSYVRFATNDANTISRLPNGVRPLTCVRIQAARPSSPCFLQRGTNFSYSLKCPLTAVATAKT